MREPFALVPIGDRLAMLPDDPESVTPGGIVLPDNAKDRPTRGTVLAIGDDVPKHGSNDEFLGEQVVQEGDKVLFVKYAGTDIEVGGKVVKLLKTSDLLARERREDE